MATRLQEQPGDRFGRWTLIEPGERNKHNKPTWLCRCECGVERAVIQESLRQGKSVSCGCFNRERVEASVTKHGLSRTPEYVAWKGMVQRCYNKSNPKYPNWGGRGITVCARWRESFADFLVDMGPKPEGLSIHRVDNDGNYEPGNCVWATDAVQARAKSSNVNITWQGRTMCVAAWAEEIGMNPEVLYNRLCVYNWTTERAFTQPVGLREGCSGETNGSVKLTEADVLAIRADSRTQVTIAKAYGITQTQVSRIIRRESWKHV